MSTITLHLSKAQKTKFNKGDPIQVKNVNSGTEVSVQVPEKVAKALNKNWSKGMAYRLKDYTSTEPMLGGRMKKANKNITLDMKSFLEDKKEDVDKKTLQLLTGGKINLGRTFKKASRAVKKKGNQAGKTLKKEAKRTGKQLKKEGILAGKSALKATGRAGIGAVIGTATGSPVVGAVAADRIMALSGADKKIDGLGLTPMQEKMAKLRAMRSKPKSSGGSFRPSGGSFKTPVSKGGEVGGDGLNAEDRGLLGVSGPWVQIQNSKHFTKRAGKKVSGSGFLQ